MGNADALRDEDLHYAAEENVVDEDAPGMFGALFGAVQWFSATPDAPHLVRELVRRQTDGWPSDTVYIVELLASELAANAVVHARTRFLVKVLAAVDVIRVDVVDSGGGHPRVRHPGVTDPTGRGLLIVDHCATRWGVSNEGTDTTVWFEVEGEPGRLPLPPHVSDPFRNPARAVLRPDR